MGSGGFDGELFYLMTKRRSYFLLKEINCQNSFAGFSFHKTTASFSCLDRKGDSTEGGKLLDVVCVLMHKKTLDTLVVVCKGPF